MFKRLIFVASLFLAVLFALPHVWAKNTSTNAPLPVAQEDTTRQPLVVSEVEKGVNRVRVQRGLGELSSNSLLRESAQARADKLCATNTWSHDGWTDSLTYGYVYAGENLEYASVVTSDSRTVVDAWVNSPTHYAVMTTPAFTEQGIGITRCAHYQGEDNTYVIVNHFREPQ